MHLVAVMLLLTGAARPPADLFDDIYTRGQRQNGAVSSVRARFVETSTSTLLRQPIVARGTLVAEMPSRLRLDYTDPAGRVVIVDERRLTLISPGADKVVRDITTAQRRAQKYFLNKTPDELRRHFTVRAFRDPQVPGTYQVEMIPTRKQIAEGLRELRIWVDDETLFLSRLHMVFATGDTKTFELDSVRLEKLKMEKGK
jgi:outer membrane lipoprotein-sorting protein